MPHPTSTSPKGPPAQPMARLELTEYELQVLQTITQHAIDAGAIRSDMLEVVSGVYTKVKSARSDLAIARRRLAVDLANERRKQGGS